MDIKRLKELREANGYSMEQFAKFIGLAVTTYKDKESGKSKFKVEELESILDFLNIDPMELLEIKKTKIKK